MKAADGVDDDEANDAPFCVLIEPNAQWPNSAFPVLAYRGVLPEGPRRAEEFQTLFTHNDWLAAWRDTIYAYDHYHATAHECLGIARGSASLRLGGEGGRTIAVAAGDVLVLPAGVAHRLIEGDELEVVGAYPLGQLPDRLLGHPNDRPQADWLIARLPIPATDPVWGSQGPLPRLWREAMSPDA